MSTGKRLAKRSILGTRVCAPRSDGRYRPGVIHATKTDADGRENLYCVLFEDKSTSEYKNKDLVGPGFQSVTRVRLCQGQLVYVTYNGREVSGRVVSHSPHLDEVRLTVDPSSNNHLTQTVELKKRLEEVRLLESRKSARLQDQQDTDYSRLADGQSEPRRRAASFSIDVPAINGSCRKRRPSADDDVMDDCMAAMVLMSLSCSPKSPRLPEYGMFSGGESWTSGSSSGAQSWSSWQSLPPISSPPDSPQSLSSSSGGLPDSIHGDAKDLEDGRCSRDEGIDMDDEEDEEDEDEEEDSEVANTPFLTSDELDSALVSAPLTRSKGKPGCKVVFQCTWRGCNLQFDACDEVERHVRSEHLSDSDLTDHEEEFYYTEVEMEQLDLMGQLEDSVSPDSPPGGPGVLTREEEVSFTSIYTSSAPTLSHLDMVRPPHEDPEYRRTLVEPPPASPINIPQLATSVPWQQHAYAASAPGIMVSPQKLMRLSPKTVSSSLKGSPLHRKGRSESRKCRKIYGMENREAWCTQCKWKKACTRFQD